jgi:hypothetical protein
MAERTHIMEPSIVGAHIDTWILNVKGTLLETLAEQLDSLKELAQETEEDVGPSRARHS